jgi:cytidylate kinase
MSNLVITIDGPAASGKSTVARLLAERLGASFLDTGAMYRAVTLAAIEAGVDMSDEEKLLGVLETSEFQFAVKEGKMAVRIDGVDVTERIDVKFYLTADAGERARRRQAELRAGGGGEPRPSDGLGESLKQIQRAIEERDKSDEDRAVGPLRPADDAVVIDTTDLTIEEVVEKVLRCVKEKCLTRNQK